MTTTAYRLGATSAEPAHEPMPPPVRCLRAMTFYLHSEAAATACKAALAAMLVSLFGYLPGGVALYGTFGGFKAVASVLALASSPDVGSCLQRAVLKFLALLGVTCWCLAWYGVGIEGVYGGVPVGINGTIAPADMQAMGSAALVNGSLFVFQVALQLVLQLISQHYPQYAYATYLGYILWMVNIDIELTVSQFYGDNIDALGSFNYFGTFVGIALLATLIGLAVMLIIAVVFSPIFTYRKISNALAELTDAVQMSVSRLAYVAVEAGAPPTKDQAVKLSAEVARLGVIHRKAMAESTRIMPATRFEVQIDPNVRYSNQRAAQMYEQLFVALANAQQMAAITADLPLQTAEQLPPGLSGALLERARDAYWALERTKVARLLAVKATLRQYAPLEAAAPSMAYDGARRERAIEDMRVAMVALCTHAVAASDEHEARQAMHLALAYLRNAACSQLVEFSIGMCEKIAAESYGARTQIETATT